MAQNHIDDEKKKLAEQYFTPLRVSEIMADMFAKNTTKELTALDPCCGVGNLAAALLSRSNFYGEKTNITLIEKDTILAKVAMENFKDFKNAKVIESDFFKHTHQPTFFDRIIVNPPYSKIPLDSELSKSCQETLGYRDSNIYSAFVSHCLQLLSSTGELVAIIPRSFCNGTTFKGFRKFILSNFYIHEIYLFESRRIFWDSSVLQETVIIKISKLISNKIKVSHERLNGEVNKKTISRDRVFFEADLQKFIHIPLAHGDDELLEKMAKFKDNLLSLGLRASTGKVVDFRCKELLSSKKTSASSHLLYQDSISAENRIIFDPENKDKQRFIKHQKGAQPVLIPIKNYIIIRRISFKESKTRIVAAPLLAHLYKDEHIGIENHLNYIWGEHISFSSNACLALFAYLSTPTIDLYIRRFSGHTQINATDLNSLPTPNLAELENFGSANLNSSLDEIKNLAELHFFTNN
nr:N-6 DNA methylase [Pseudomonas chlororaphis]